MLSVLNETGQSSFQWGDACRCRIGAALSHPMCGRYTSFLPAKAIGAVHPLPNLAPSWNVAPTQSAPVVRRHPEAAERHLDLLKWGLLPYWMKEPT